LSAYIIVQYKPILYSNPGLVQEFEHRISNLIKVVLKREMTPIHKFNLCILQHGFERFRAGRDEDPVVFAPDCEDWRLAVTEVLLEFWVHLYVLAVVEEEVELDVTVAWAVEEGLVEVIRLRRDCRRIFFTRGVLSVRGPSIRDHK
jgi:hypothetical protein